MSAKQMGKVWELELTHPKQSVLLALADHADHNGRGVKPGVPFLAWKTGYSERHVRRIMDELESDGLLVRVKERKGKPTIYDLDLNKGIPKAPYVPREERTTDSNRVTPDNLSSLTPDKMTSDKMSGVTSHAKKVELTPDMPSANLTRIRHKDEPSLEEESSSSQRPNIFGLFEQAFGLTVNSQVLADDLKDAEKEFPYEWLVDAFREAALRSIRNWKYVRATLDNWQRDGKPTKEALAARRDSNQPKPAPPPPNAAQTRKPPVDVQTLQFQAEKEGRPLHELIAEATEKHSASSGT